MTTHEAMRQKLEEIVRQKKKPLIARLAQGALSAAKGIGKGALKDLIVTPATRVGQVAAYGVGAVVGGERGEKIKDKALGDQKIKLGPLGQYDVEAMRGGTSGLRQAAGQGLKAATWLYTPGGVAGAAGKQTFKQVAKQAIKSGALMGGAYSAGESLERKNLTPKQFLKDTVAGAVSGAVAGGVLGAAGYGAGKLTKVAIQAQKSPANEAGFVKVPFAKDEIKLYRGGAAFDQSQLTDRGLPLTTNKSVAKKFADNKKAFDGGVAGQILGKDPSTNIIEEYILSSNAKIATRSNIPDDLYKAYKSTNPVLNPEKGEILLGRWAKANGFDAIDYRTLGKTSAKEAEIKVLNPQVLLTNSQKAKSVAQTAGKAGQLPEVKTGPLPEVPVSPQIKSSYKGVNAKSSSVASPSNLVKPKVNLDRLGLPERVKNSPVVQAEIEKAREIGSRVTGKKMTNQDVIDRAAVTKEIVNSPVYREQTLADAAALYKARQKAASTVQRVDTTGKMTKEDFDALVAPITNLTNTARILQTGKIKATPNEQNTINNVLKSLMKEVDNIEELKKAATNIDWRDSEAVAKLYRTFIKPRASEWLDLLRYNSMLSSPNTHLVNISSNAQGTGIIAPIEKTITGVIDATRAALTGAPRKYAVGEGAAYAKGYYKNLAAGARTFMSVIRGRSITTNPDVMRMPLTTTKKGRILERTLDWPLRLLEAQDQMFATMTEGGVNAALTYRAKAGIKTAGEDAAKEAAERLFRGQFNAEGQGYVLGVIDDLGARLGELRNSENPVTATVAKFTVPFLRTPVNLLKAGVEYSPLGVSTLVGNTNKTQQLSKIIIGSSSAAAAAMLLGQDRLTWAEPTNAKQKAEFKAAGRQPYSIKFGNKWISYSKLHPAVSFNLALISAVDDSLKQQRLDESQADSILSAFAKYGSFVADQSYLKNIGDFVSGIKGDTEGWSKLASNYPQQIIPFRAMMSWIERLTDPNQRMADPTSSGLEKQMQQIMAQIPGLAQNVPIRTGPLGQPIENQNRLVNAFSPNRVTTSDKLYESLLKSHEEQLRLKRMKADMEKKVQDQIKRNLLKR